MNLGFVSAILGELDRQQVFEAAAQIGYDSVELMCWPPSKAERRYAGVTHLDVSQFTADDAARLREQAAAAGVRISGLGYYPNPLSPRGDEGSVAIEHIRSVIRATELLGIGQMNTFIGRDWTRSVDDNWPRFVEVWTPLVQFAADRGVRIGIENCPMFFSNDEWPGGKNLATSPSIWRRMFESIPQANFGLNYDPSHMIWQQMDYLAPIHTFKERIFHVHAKDARVDRQRLDDVGILANPNQYHTPKLPGLGDIDWGPFVAALCDIGYQGAVSVEVEDRAFEHSLESRRAALRQSHTYLRNFIPVR